MAREHRLGELRRVILQSAMLSQKAVLSEKELRFEVPGFQRSVGSGSRTRCGFRDQCLSRFIEEQNRASRLGKIRWSPSTRSPLPWMVAASFKPISETSKVVNFISSIVDDLRVYTEISFCLRVSQSTAYVTFTTWHTG